MDDFTRGYLGCALWTGTDDSDEPLDGNYDLSDFAPAAIERAAADCARFQEVAAADLEAFYRIWPVSPDGDSAEAFAGHNFWLTRNGHGVGFWDRDAGEAGERLTDECRRFSESYVYIGDDGQLWIS